LRALRVKQDVQAVIFDYTPKKNVIFLLIGKLDALSHKRDWRLVKGGVEPGETEIEALMREIFEETGLKNVKVLDKIYSYEFFFRDTRHIVSSYLVKADSGEQVCISGASERRPIVSYKWMDYESALRALRWKNEKIALKRGMKKINLMQAS